MLEDIKSRKDINKVEKEKLIMLLLSDNGLPQKTVKYNVMSIFRNNKMSCEDVSDMVMEY